ncbi:helix-turn-helix domain-containing protein [Corynebacterium striatum]|uniref:helix-turn-helix domain-containing protein n=1 Tax=Corynebacterium striatum TaxID=43770 RepID=UPI003B5BFD3A
MPDPRRQHPTQNQCTLKPEEPRNWTKEGRLPAYKAGKMYKYKLSEVDQWLRDGRLDQENAIG